MTGLNGAVAIVTASTQGIGFAISKRLAQAGASVVLSSRKQKNVDLAIRDLSSQGFKVAGISCHVANADDRKRLVEFTLEKFGKIDILVSNAAVNPHFGSLLEVTEEIWDKIFDINVKSAFLLTKEIVPHLRNGGSIVYVSSVAGYLPMPGIFAYSVSKTALLGLTKAMAQTVADKGIRVNCIAPGIIKTNFSRALTEAANPSDPSVSITLRRFGEPDECAGLVAFLCSKEASYITGETFLVSGGIPARL